MQVTLMRQSTYQLQYLWPNAPAVLQPHIRWERTEGSTPHSDAFKKSQPRERDNKSEEIIEALERSVDDTERSDCCECGEEVREVRMKGKES